MDQANLHVIQQFKVYPVIILAILFSTSLNGQDIIPKELYRSTIKILNPFIDTYKPKFRYPFYLAYPERLKPEGPVVSIVTINTKNKSRVIEKYEKGKLLKKESFSNGVLDKRLYYYSIEGLLDSLKIENSRMKEQKMVFTYEKDLISSTTINQKTTTHISLNDTTQLNLRPQGTFDTLIYDQKGNLVYEVTNYRSDEDLAVEKKFQVFNDKNQIVSCRNISYTLRGNEILYTHKDTRIEVSYNKNGLVKSYIFGNYKDNQYQPYYDRSYDYEITKKQDGNFIIEQIDTDAVMKQEAKRIYTLDEHMNWTYYQEYINQKLKQEIKREISYE